MNNHKLIFLLVISLFLLSGCQPADSYQGRVILGGEHQLGKDAAVPGELVVIDGRVVLSAGSRVEGSLVVLGGDVLADGLIEGDVTVIRGDLEFGPRVHIRGDLNAGGGHLEGWQQARIEGEVTESIGLELPVDVLAPNQGPWDVARRRLLYSLVTAFLVFITARFMPRGSDRIGAAVVSHPAVCGALGLLVFLVGPILIVQMAFTVVLIPIAFVSLLLGVGVGLLGFSGMARILGDWLRKKSDILSNKQAALAAAAAFLSLAIHGLNYFPLLGGLAAILMTALAVGAVFLTGFGTRKFVPDR